MDRKEGYSYSSSKLTRKTEDENERYQRKRINSSSQSDLSAKLAEFIVRYSFQMNLSLGQILMRKFILETFQQIMSLIENY